MDRKSPESRAESVERMRQALQSGFSILLYPEGTRNRGDQPLTDFYDGAFRLAAETGFPMAVMTLNDPRKYNDPVQTDPAQTPHKVVYPLRSRLLLFL